MKVPLHGDTLSRLRKRNDTSHFPIRARSHATEHASLVMLQDQLSDDWIVRIDRPDYGIDGEIEVVGRNRIVVGNIVNEVLHENFLIVKKSSFFSDEDV